MRLPNQHLRTDLLPTGIRILLPSKIIIPILRNKIIIANRHDIELLLPKPLRTVGNGDDGDGFPLLVELSGVGRSAVVEIEAREVGGVVEVDEWAVVFYDDVGQEVAVWCDGDGGRAFLVEDVGCVVVADDVDVAVGRGGVGAAASAVSWVGC